jgi:hypothetical protein
MSNSGKTKGRETRSAAARSRPNPRSETKTAVSGACSSLAPTAAEVILSRNFYGQQAQYDKEAPASPARVPRRTMFMQFQTIERAPFAFLKDA